MRNLQFYQRVGALFTSMALIGTLGACQNVSLEKKKVTLEYSEWTAWTTYSPEPVVANDMRQVQTFSQYMIKQEKEVLVTSLSEKEPQIMIIPEYIPAASKNEPGAMLVTYYSYRTRHLGEKHIARETKETLDSYQKSL